jgi:hypothetical protein
MFLKYGRLSFGKHILKNFVIFSGSSFNMLVDTFEIWNGLLQHSHRVDDRSINPNNLDIGISSHSSE